MTRPIESTVDKILREAAETQRHLATFEGLSSADKIVQDAMKSQKLLDDALGGSAVAKQVRELMEGQRRIDEAYGLKAIRNVTGSFDALYQTGHSQIGTVPHMEREIALLASQAQTQAKPKHGHQPLTSATDLAPLIRKARKRMGMNQQAFADAAGVGRRFLSELENGKPSLEFDKVLACALAAGIDIMAKPRLPL
jgi:y4mF family transcriptional regulator